MQNDLISLSLAFSALGFVYLSLLIIRRYQHKRQASRPSVSETRRSPGHSLLMQIDTLDGEIQICITAVAAAPILLVAVHLLDSQIFNAPQTVVRLAITAVSGLLFAGGYTARLLQLLSRRRQTKLRCDDEVATAHELTQLISNGYHVFHDFPGQQVKIDHVVVGPTGVMTIDTCTQFKGASRNRKTDSVVTYDGRMLHFPKYSDHQIIDRAKYQAAWLSQWLSEAVGEDVCARAMVALPGWFVKRTSADGIPVVNPKQFETLFDHIKPRPLPAEMIARICSAIERQCLETDPQGDACRSTLLDIST